MFGYYGDNYESTCPSYVSQPSTATTKTSLSSKYTIYTEGSEIEKISFNVGMKLVLVIFTLIAGAILALGINVWRYKREIAVPADAKIFPADDVEHRGPMPYCQYQNEKTKLCLDDMQPSATLSKGRIYLFHCHSFFASSQFFHHGKDGEISKPRDATFEDIQDRMCVDRDGREAVLDNCVPFKDDQTWIPRSQSLSNIVNGLCLTAISIGQPVLLMPCGEVSAQFWKCLEVNKNDRLFNMHYQERNLTYNKLYEL